VIVPLKMQPRIWLRRRNYKMPAHNLVVASWF
jgi:hypothetical protein